MANIAKVNDFKALVNTREMMKRMTTTCGGKDAAGQFLASMLDLYESDNYLQSCDPQKVLMECLKAASLKLPLVKSLGYAYVVPYKNTPTFVIGYKGYIQLALRSGKFSILNTDCIYEGEDVGFNRLTGQMTISGTAMSNKAIGYFAYFKLVNGFEKTLYMTTEQIQEYAQKYSRAYNSSSSPWRTEFDAMAKKTVLRQIMKFAPMSTDMAAAEQLEVEYAQAKAQSHVNANANRTPIDVPATFDVNAAFIVDEATGEVLDDPVAAEAAEESIPVGAAISAEADYPVDPGF